MPDAISNTSPLLYLYRVDAIAWLPRIFEKVWVPTAVVTELAAGQHRGYDVPDPRAYAWLEIVEPQQTPSEWFALELGPGELAAMALAFEHPTCIVLLDDQLARRTAQAAGLTVWGTLKVLIEAKARGLVPAIAPYVTGLSDAGMWISSDVRRRILALAGE